MEHSVSVSNDASNAATCDFLLFERRESVIFSKWKFGLRERGLSIFRKAKKFMENVDNVHDRISAGISKASGEDNLRWQRDDAREVLEDIRREEEDSSEDDGRLVRFPNPGRDWTKKKNQRFLELTNTPEVVQDEEERARMEQANSAYRASAAENAYEPANGSSNEQNSPDDTNYTLVRYKRRKGTW